ncbi:LysM peptidoglycan-binding domain-containing protein [Rothia nasimurium]|uniref:LysM peptidoglycan-binding domain-containing protein n=1 Tax=Rothia nasimurium TaxID=85336 RepID=UPI002DD69EB9|nr:LysM peptidoglycan-binding domain-containing protein [Rothia nasimurium]
MQPDFSEDVAATTYTVAPGDSLWSIAEDQLTPDASGAEVLALVHTIWQLNQKTIPTLDTLIFPGQTITLPR